MALRIQHWRGWCPRRQPRSASHWTTPAWTYGARPIGCRCRGTGGQSALRESERANTRVRERDQVNVLTKSHLHDDQVDFLCDVWRTQRSPWYPHTPLFVSLTGGGATARGHPPGRREDTANDIRWEQRHIPLHLQEVEHQCQEDPHREQHGPPDDQVCGPAAHITFNFIVT